MTQSSPPVLCAAELQLNAQRRQLLADNAQLALQVQGNVPSPCISVCTLDVEMGWCKGCLRTLDELRVWAQSTDAAKRLIWGDVAKRLADMPV